MQPMSLSRHMSTKGGVRFAITKFDMKTVALDVADLQRRETVEHIIREVKQSGDETVYCFVVMQASGNVVRYYPINIDH